MKYLRAYQIYAEHCLKFSMTETTFFNPLCVSEVKCGMHERTRSSISCEK
jgi:hypothetical protein